MIGKDFRYIPMAAHDAATNMALDEACMNSVRDGLAPPTIRIYRWKPSAITIGAFQCMQDEVDIEACKRDGIPIVRRQTGGGAVFHDSEGEITYSIVAPEHLFSKDIVKSSQEICQAIIEGLNEIGVKSEFRPINDLVIEGRKVSGNAQTRRGGILVQHGTILLSVDAAKMFTYLTPDKSKLTDKPFIKSVSSAVTGISEHSKAPREKIERAILDAFHRRYPGTIGTWTRGELVRAVALVEAKYTSDAWNAVR